MVDASVVKEATSISLYRGMIIMSCVFACVAAVNYMQTLFDRGDLRRATNVIRDFRGPGGGGIEERIRERHADRITGDVLWDTRIHSSCYGVILVTATAPLRDASPAVYRWHVDLVNNGIHPADDNGRDVLQELSLAPKGNEDGGSAVAPGGGPLPAPDHPESPP